MTIHVTERTIAVWFLNITEWSDFLGGLEHAENGKFRFTYRFRYYASPKAWDTKDRKNWYQGDLTAASKSEALSKLQKFINTLEIGTGYTADEILMRNGNVNAFMDEMASKQWAHAESEKEGRAK